MGHEVSFPQQNGTTQGYLAKPASGSGPGVVVLQEWWGLVPHIKSVADRFAQMGFVALAPDLYQGRTTTSPDEAGRLFMALQVDVAERELAAAIAYLKTHATGGKVGVVGFCMGGQLALFAATKNAEVGACIDFYGVHPEVKPDFAQLTCPVLGFFGGQDTFVTREHARALAQRIQEAGQKAEFHVYDEVGHAFFNDSRPEVYSSTRAAQAFDRSVAFLRAQLA